MASGASARTLFSLLIGLIVAAVAVAPASANETGPDCAGLVPTIAGSNVGEWITGTEGADVIRAGAGADTINGLGGNDVICAGPGDDTTRAGQGNDMVRSGRGNDSSSGEAGDDAMRGQGDDDLADGGGGVDECLFETHEHCEADLDVNLTGPDAGFTGGPEIAIYAVRLANHGPTPAVNSRVDIELPTGATLVVEAADPLCAAFDADTVRCTFGSMGLELPASASFGLTFAGCDERTPTLNAEANDPRTNDHVEPNTTDSLSTSLSSSPACAPVAVDDEVTVDEDSGANTIDVLANDIDNGTPFEVGSKTNGTHGTVAITHGGADVSYTPDPGYCGADSFTYELTPGGSTATVDVTVVCVDDPPTAVDDAATVDHDSGANTIDVLANDTDSDGGPLAVESTSDPENGTAAVSSGGGDVTYTPDPGFCGQDEFTYDLAPGGSQATVSVTVRCAEAVDDAATVNEDSGANTIDVRANDVGNGSPFSVDSATDGTHGTVAVTSGGDDLSYTPDPGYCGDDSFTYSLAPGGSIAKVDVTVVCVDDAPEAVDDAATVDHDSGANTIDVLANDTDSDGGPIAVGAKTDGANGTVAITSGGADLTYTPDPGFCGQDSFTYDLTPGGSQATVSITVLCPEAVDDAATVNEDSGANTIDVRANDIGNGTPFSVSSTTDGANGSVAITGGGDDVSYTPDPNFCGDDSFTYDLSPGGDTATVTITVNCDPTAVDDAATVDHDSGANTIDVLANDTDPENDSFDVGSTTDGSNGTVTITSGGADLSYTPDPGFCGQDSFTYQLSPGGSQATVSITVRCPVAEDDAFTVGEDSGANQLDVRANDTGNGTPFAVASATNGANGTVAVTNGGDDVSYTPDPDFCGDDSFTYELTPGGDTATVDVTVTCENDAPDAVDDAANYNCFSGPQTIDVLANDSDPDNDSLTITAVTQGVNGGTVTITNGGADLTYEQNGFDDDSFTYTVSDGNGGTDTATVTISNICSE